MRKLKLQVQVSLDGYVAGPNGEMDWMNFQWDDALKQYTQELTDTMDTILLGRKMAEGFIPYWAGVAADDQHTEQAVGRIFTDAERVVFSRSLQQSPWPGVALANDLEAEVRRLKAADGKDIIVYGGAELVSGLLRARLIDEIHLFVNPTAIGEGLSIFRDRCNFALIKATPFGCGIVVLHYATSA
ncbi:MAG: dihydrofolate reductase [Chitinophagaceae bacterium]|nr:MAG: dihydrofolate reductase [Chitinophagaceae bacterium]